MLDHIRSIASARCKRSLSTRALVSSNRGRWCSCHRVRSRTERWHSSLRKPTPEIQSKSASSRVINSSPQPVNSRRPTGLVLAPGCSLPAAVALAPHPQGWQRQPCCAHAMRPDSQWPARAWILKDAEESARSSHAVCAPLHCDGSGAPRSAWGGVSWVAHWAPAPAPSGDPLRRQRSVLP